MTVNYNGAIKSLRDIVWGVVTDPLSQIEQITLLIFIKLLSERHNELERLKAKKLIFTGEYASYHFDSLSRLSGYELVDTTRKAVESLYKNPNIDEPVRRLYERSYLQVNDPRVLSLLINEINKIDITHIDMGDFYEHLLAILGTQKEAGQFRTPRHLIEFIVDIVDPQIGERVLDPACGTAGFLTAAYTHIRDSNTSQEAKKTDSYLDKLNFDQKTFLLNKTIFGFDIDPKMIKFAISNLYLHNIKNPNISQHNTLTSNDSWEEKYEVILTNPPFSTPKGGVRPTDRFTLDSKRTEVLFAEYVIEHLTLSGRAGVIVPEGIIFQSGKAYKELRKWLVENNYLYAVVSLPSGVFNPYSGVKTSILFLDRERAQKSDKILFCKVDNDGFDLGAQRRPIDKNDLPEVLRVVKEYKKDPDKPIDSKLAYFVIKDKIIQSGDYNFSGDRYRVATDYNNAKWPMVELGEVIKVNFGERITKNNQLGTKYPVYGGGGESFRTDNFNRENEYVISRFAMAENCVRYVKGQFWLMDSGGTFSINKESESRLSKDFVGKVLLSRQSDIFRCARGGAQKNLNVNHFYELSIPLPPLSLQQQIVDELDGYQKVIDGARQVVDNYKPQIKIDPKWEVFELKDICDVRDGTHDSPEYQPEGSPLITSKNIIDGKIDFSTAKFISKTDLQKINKRSLVEDGDIIMPMIGTIGYPIVVKKDRDFAIKNVALIKLYPVSKINRLFLKYVLESDIFYKTYTNFSRGTTQKFISLGFIRGLKIPLPTLQTQKQIVANIEEEQKLVEANKKLIQLFEQKIKDKIEEVWGEKNGNI